MATAKNPGTSPATAPAADVAAKATAASPAAKPAKAKAVKPAKPSKPAKPAAVAKPKAPAAKKPAAKTAPAKVVAPKVAKPKKPKLVRDSFTIPKAEYLVLDELKQRATKLALPAKKSELLRAGIKALAAMDDAALTTALGNVPAIKTGRPKND